MVSQFEKELADLLNCHSKENGSNTPDFILAQYLNNCLENFNEIVRRRSVWSNHQETFVMNDLIEETPELLNEILNEEEGK